MRPGTSRLVYADKCSVYDNIKYGRPGAGPEEVCDRLQWASLLYITSPLFIRISIENIYHSYYYFV